MSAIEDIEEEMGLAARRRNPTVTLDIDDMRALLDQHRALESERDRLKLERHRADVRAVELRAEVERLKAAPAGGIRCAELWEADHESRCVRFEGHAGTHLSLIHI